MNLTINNPNRNQSPSFGRFTKLDLGGLSKNARKVVEEIVVDPEFQELSKNQLFDIQLVTVKHPFSKAGAKNSLSCDFLQAGETIGSFQQPLGRRINNINIETVKSSFVEKLISASKWFITSLTDY